MPYGFLDIAVTPAVLATQVAMHTDHLWRDFQGQRQFDRFSERERAFIGSRDSIYIASISETGWPYIQHRGGPRGFVKIIDDQTLAFADYQGNRQYITAGNISAMGRACLFLMDYTRPARLKIFARAEVKSLDEEPELSARVLPADGETKVERILLLHLEAFDWNCPKHIVPRFSESEVHEAMTQIRERMAFLENENKSLRTRIEAETAQKDSFEARISPDGLDGDER